MSELRRKVLLLVFLIGLFMVALLGATGVQLKREVSKFQQKLASGESNNSIFYQPDKLVP
ncbi:hypothetical protein DN752_16570 [Echinicola strongylocentroti]|uniref:Uncharacterized protein n=1 Tax=Echinicola strongylocentroti TaxID=1795355 RepID=A0A2Z4IM12_9BACT|nr:hypothetical protein [Echinicola strongylocentroti]AWW31606.1 hypothetical protein DN752_16570 [Echinicola strongylocentroti]